MLEICRDFSGIDLDAKGWTVVNENVSQPKQGGGVRVISGLVAAFPTRKQAEDFISLRGKSQAFVSDMVQAAKIHAAVEIVKNVTIVADSAIEDLFRNAVYFLSDQLGSKP